ncbi:MAG: hypothetical protein A3K09_07540 [Nitrospinae bacterium RIFCSPLOWO2_12_FULL_47_7]|nr:MAG: hypothetical protein A3K09_07540 [Nitrospinae bacterium RIFCSPLOWO2_12_FULL_47_7]
MNPQSKLEDLQAVAEKLSIAVEFSNLSNNEISIKSGYCKLKNKDMIILDKTLSPEEQIEIILQALKRFDLENIYIPSWVRERLEMQG